MELDVLNLMFMPNGSSERQHTLAAPVKVSGIGLHTGVQTNLVLRPAPANTGIVFKRTDLDGFVIRARAGNVTHVSYATSLMSKGVLVSTTEHLLSALGALGVDNAYAEMDNIEVPIMDGSALPFAREIIHAGLRRQRARRDFIRILKPVEISDGNKRLAVYPSETFRISCSIEFAHPLIRNQAVEFSQCSGDYLGEIAPARTFGFLEEAEKLRQAGLVRGGSLENAVVLSEDAVLNPEGLRFPDEFVRHKLLDLIGDLMLLGHPLTGHVVAHRAGHAMHYALVSRLLEEKSAWRLAGPAPVRTSAA
ncbi:MAG: UDP-3-O-acyl-N-acetylglucosamine deacetylase [Terriglobia bacterium]